MYEYTFIAKYILFSICISFVLSLLSVLIVDQAPDVDKVSSYECGFNPYGDARNKFDIQFYLVGILFLVFDLELALLTP